MARYVGRDLHMEFIHAAGTATFSADFRSLDVNATTDQADSSAGTATHRYWIPTIRDGSGDISLLDPGGATGSAYWVGTAPQTHGTFIWAPIGTTSTYPKFTVPDAHVTERSVSYPYDDVVEWSISIQFNTAPVQTAY